MSEPFDPNAAPPPGFPPPGYAGAPMGTPPTNVPAYGAPPPAGVPGGYDVPAYGAPPPRGSPHGQGIPLPHDMSATGVLAGFGARLGGTLIDGLITSLLSFVAAIPLGLLVWSRWETTPEPCTVNGQPSTCDLPTDATLRVMVGAFAAFFLFSLILGFVYHVRSIAKTGQTPGRKMLGIRVVNAATGQPPSLGKALLRYFFASMISGNPCALGYLWMLWDSQNQTWHDKVASTVVVQA